ncbi:MAG: UDP-N-acetylglucosamine 2-epimerase, partial [Lachnospiraceae bacterium]|nr:UDP-N-acetylglucosamine 2-epimerase [Lachnospiraceae bacterium]
MIGARPQFIKAAVVSRELRKMHDEVMVHTGQHYDYNMSDVFFEELDIPKPNYNLGISGGSHGKMTGEMLIKIEEVLINERPDMVLVYGDTNSTMAGALAAVKQHIPVIHVEAGNRLGTLNNPEEVNSIVTDHVSSLRLCCTESAFLFLKQEGLVQNTFVVGDPMYDAFKYYSEKTRDEVPELLFDLNGNDIELPDEFYYMTCHREENTGTDDTLLEILEAMENLDRKCLYPVHPRNKNRVIR